MSRPTVDPEHSRLRQILDTLIEENVAVTASAVIARHEDLNAVSAITRSPERMALVRDYQKRQRTARDWQRKASNTTHQKLINVLAERDLTVEALQQQVTTLVEGHVAMVNVVAEMGGMQKLTEYYSRFRDLRERIKATPN